MPSALPREVPRSQIEGGQIEGDQIRSSESVPEGFGALAGCFVEGDADERQRERRVKRSSLVLSVILEMLVLIAVLLFPLFGKPERIAWANATPVPPYFPHGNPLRHVNPEPDRQRPIADLQRFTFSPPNAPARPRAEGTGAAGEEAPPITAIGGGYECGGGCIPVSAAVPPRAREETSEPPKRLVTTHLDPASLVVRVEPVYPTLARQMRREGQVKLRAIIATDGTIVSLEYASGDSLFFASARDAVQQWRYRPTALNGQAVEVDTIITVIYRLAP